MCVDRAWYDDTGGRGIGVDGRNASPLCVLSTPIPFCVGFAVLGGGLLCRSIR